MSMLRPGGGGSEGRAQSRRWVDASSRRRAGDAGQGAGGLRQRRRRMRRAGCGGAAQRCPRLRRLALPPGPPGRGAESAGRSLAREAGRAAAEGRRGPTQRSKRDGAAERSGECRQGRERQAYRTPACRSLSLSLPMCVYPVLLAAVRGSPSLGSARARQGGMEGVLGLGLARGRASGGEAGGRRCLSRQRWNRGSDSDTPAPAALRLVSVEDPAVPLVQLRPRDSLLISPAPPAKRREEHRGGVHHHHHDDDVLLLLSSARPRVRGPGRVSISGNV
eukprot:scaffold1677_cov247-Prasinococcus_capsulatus_cf.AAC.3